MGEGVELFLESVGNQMTEAHLSRGRGQTLAVGSTL